jgi:ATP-dependent Clp protease ATP-binding subunit ClpC
MYERFTDRVRTVLRLAQEEALDAKHEFVGTEDLLVGLAAEGSGVAAHVLKNLGVYLATLRIEIQKQNERDPLGSTEGKAPENDHLKTVIENAWHEARKYPEGDRLRKIIENAWNEACNLTVSKQFQSVVVYSMQEAKALGHNYVGTEHLLLGLLGEPEGVAAKVLSNLDLKLEDVRQEVLNLLGHGLTPTEGPRTFKP